LKAGFHLATPFVPEPPGTAQQYASSPIGIIAQNPLTKTNKPKQLIQNGSVVKSYRENVQGAKGNGQHTPKNGLNLDFKSKANHKT
jgi:hypothetical protein